MAGGSTDRAGESVDTGERDSTFSGKLFSHNQFIFMVASSVLCIFCYISGFSFLQLKNAFANGETTELSGRCIVNLATGRFILLEMVFTSVSDC